MSAIFDIKWWRDGEPSRRPTMDWTTVRAGDPIECAAVGHRVWRYRLGPPLVLLSFCLGDSRVWPSDAPYEADKEPSLHDTKMVRGIYAFMTLSDLRKGFPDLLDPLRHRDIYEGPGDPAYFDGVVRGTVVLWGVCVDCKDGYRAQYARPYSFDEAHGDQADVALERLRRMFGV